MSRNNVTLDMTDDVARLTVDRPDALNALNAETLEEVGAALGEAEAREARVLVLAGAGDDAFIAGADVERMREFSTPEALAYAELGQGVVRDILGFPGVTIAAIDGYAFGGGCEFALACDLRVASEQAVLGQTEIDLGIIPGWGGTQLLQRLVPDETARRLILFGDRLDASDAYERGLVGDVVAHDELDDHVDGMATELAAKPRHALYAATEALDAYHEAGGESGFTVERRAWSGLFGTPDQREGMAAFVEKRDPQFE